MKRCLTFILFLLPLLAQGQLAIVTGAETLLSGQGGYWRQIQGKTVGVVSNQTSVVGPQGTHLVDTLLRRGVAIKTIFCPEHGFRGQAEAGAAVGSGKDARTGIPIVSLYGKNKKPLPEQLRGLDLVVFDLQDVGCRFYTYISTLAYVMEACAESRIPVMVLDRPNPNGGYVDGPVLEPRHRSFVGLHPVPIVYGMTIGEYARMIDGERWLGMQVVDGQWRKDTALRCPLVVVPLQGYTHQSRYRLPVAPSPNLQTPQAIMLYPSVCLFEGTQISVGRGTDTPFEVIGSPQYAGEGTFHFTPHPIKGVSENPPFKGQLCCGLDLRHEPATQALNLGYLLDMYGGTPHETFFLKSGFFEKLAGTSALRRQLQGGVSEADIRASWQPRLEQFKRIRQKYLIYE